MADLPWPLAAIDFEASSLEWDGYPIEVGIALWQAPGAPLLGWSALIRPTLAWREGGHWSRASAKVHGIGGRELQDRGLPPDTVANVLNSVLEPVGMAWCDGGPYDAQWAGSLFKAAGCRAGFLLHDWGGLLARFDRDTRSRILAHAGETRRHRARADAEQLLLALAAVTGVPIGPAANLPGLPVGSVEPERG